MPESKGERAAPPEEEIVGEGLATTDPYPHGGPPQLRIERVTGEYPADGELRAELIEASRPEVPGEIMGGAQTALDSMPRELTSADVEIIEDGDGIVALPAIPRDLQREGVPREGEIFELTTEQLLGAIESGSAVIKVPLADRTTEIITPEDVLAAAKGNIVPGRIREEFDREIVKCVSGFNDAILFLLQTIRDKYCERYKDRAPESIEFLLEALNIPFIVQAIMNDELRLLVNRGYIEMADPE